MSPGHPDPPGAGTPRGADERGLASLFVAELLGLLFLTAFVLEVVLSVPGLGEALFDAVQSRDVPVVMGVTLVFVALGLAGSLLQDLLKTALDPRISE